MELTSDQAFEKFYHENFLDLPKWVNEPIFKEEMRSTYIDALEEARKTCMLSFNAPWLLFPLRATSIDMGSYNMVDNYAFFFENPELELSTYSVKAS
jgi:hypothetical protein